MKLIRQTKRMQVFESDLLRATQRADLRVYVALPHFDDREDVVPAIMPLVTALVGFDTPQYGGRCPGGWLEWLETARWLDRSKAQGLRDEFMEVLTGHLPGLFVDCEKVEDVDDDDEEDEDEDYSVSYLDTVDARCWANPREPFSRRQQQDD
jgi:hypothetical protein